MRRTFSVVITVVAALASAAPASAQRLGVFQWQLLPYCNVLTLTVTQQGTEFLVDGTDSQCGGANAPLAVRGLAFQKPSGAIGFGLSIVGPGGAPVHVDAEITLPSYSGSWSDSGGLSGSFALGSTGTGSIAPRAGFGSTALAAGSVTAAKIAADAVGTSALADGAVTAAKLAPGVGGTGDITGVTAGAGLSGGAASGNATLSVAFAGSGAASSVARSDHTHTAPVFALECTPTFTSSGVSANGTFDIQIPTCPATYTITGAGCRTPGFNEASWAINGLFRLAPNSLLAFCSGTNLTAGPITVEGTAQCCRVVQVP